MTKLINIYNNFIFDGFEDEYLSSVKILWYFIIIFIALTIVYGLFFEMFTLMMVGFLVTHYFKWNDKKFNIVALSVLTIATLGDIPLLDYPFFFSFIINSLVMGMFYVGGWLGNV